MEGLAGFDLRRVGRAGTCAGGGMTDIVVCARRRADPRLEPLPDAYADAPMRAETSLGGARVGVAMEQVPLAGMVSNRVMVRIRTPF